MKYSDIKLYPLINDVDEEKVEKIAESIKENGWTGCPILIYGESLLTGSHRLAALHMIADDEDEDVSDLVLDMEVAEDVTDIVEEAIRRREEEDGWAPDVERDHIGWLLEGSWVEEYKGRIREW